MNYLKITSKQLFIEKETPTRLVSCEFYEIFKSIFFYRAPLVVHKHPPEVFYKKRCSQKFHNIHRKTTVPESLFKQSCRPQPCNFIKKETLAQVFACEFCKVSYRTTFFLQNTFGRLLLVVASYIHVEDIEERIKSKSRKM